MKKILLFFCLTFIACEIYSQTYEPDFASLSGTQFNGEVNSIAIDGNGELLIGGDFTSYSGTTRNYFLRLNSDLSVDAGFDPSSNVSSTVGSLAVHSDNSVTIVTAGSLKRFDDTGTQFSGATFSPASVNNVINVVAAESTGHVVVIGGDFTDVGNRIARLNADGTVDATFATNIGTGFNARVRSIEITSTGKILVGGDFSSFNGTSRYKVALLNSDGTLDSSFDPGSIFQFDSQGVYAVAMQVDGRVLIGSSSLNYARVVRLAANGLLDFSRPVSSLASLVRAIVTNGTDDIVVGGWFPKGLVKLNYADGTLVITASGNGVEGSVKEVNALAVQSDGAIAIGGDFTSYNGFMVNNFSHLANCHVSIDTQPAAASACEGDDVSFTVTGSGGSQFQWQLNTASGVGEYTDISNGGGYSGATTATLSVSGTTSGMSGYRYRCVITDSDNSNPQDCFRASDPATLTVNTPQVLTAGPMDNSICGGGSAAFSISFTGTAGGFQWQEDPGTGVFSDLTNGGQYSNVNQSFLSISGITSVMDGYKYRLVSTLCQTGYTTLAATLTVNAFNEVASQPERPVLCESGNTSFSIGIVDIEPSTTIKWQYRNNVGFPHTYADLSEGGVFSGTTTETLTLTGADDTMPEIYLVESDGSSYALFRAVVTTNGCSTYTEGNKLLKIHGVPVVDGHPVEVAGLCDAGAGVNTSFSVISSISGVAYQWQVDEGSGSGFVDITDNVLYSGSASAALSLTGATAMQNGFEYRCEIGACSTPVYSNSAAFMTSIRPVITQQPTTAIICENGDTEFTVVATGGTIYQWQERIGSTFVDIVNNSTYFASDGTLQITGADLSLNNRLYRCVISSNDGCSRTSGAPALRVYATPSISGGPSNRTVCEGDSPVTFTRSASNFNGTVHTYQWQEAFAGSDIFADITDGVKFTGTSGTTLSVLDPTFSMNGNRYRLSVNGCVAEVVSDPATLTIQTPSMLTSSPTTVTICKGDNSPISFVAEATGSNLSYFWEYSQNNSNFSPLSAGIANPNPFTGFNSSTLQIDEAILDPATSIFGFSGMYYRCRISGDCNTGGALVTESAQLIINEVTLLQEHPDETLCVGSQVNLFASVAGTSLTYQWQVNDGSGYVDLTKGNGYEFVDGSALRITTAAEMSGNSYRCEVDGLCTGVVTRDILLTVNTTEKPTISPDFTNTDVPILVASQGGEEYYWYFNDAFQSSGTTQSFPLSEDGKYEVRVLINGCLSELSDPYNYVAETTLGLSENDKIRIYPNPIKDFLKTDVDRTITIQVFGMDGKLNVRKRLERNESLNLESLKMGQYIIQLTDNGELIFSGKILKIN